MEVFPIGIPPDPLSKGRHGQGSLTTLIHTRIINYIHYKSGMKILIHSQTSAVKLLRFWKGYVISSHTLLCLWLLIHGITIIHVCQRSLMQLCIISEPLLWRSDYFFFVSPNSVSKKSKMGVMLYYTFGIFLIWTCGFTVFRKGQYQGTMRFYTEPYWGKTFGTWGRERGPPLASL